MKRTALTLALILTASTASIALAGEDHKKCAAGTQECLDQMRAKLAAKGWVGIETEPADGGGYQVARVIPGSPAEAAGLRAGDVLVALNGVAMNEENKEKLYAAKKTLVPGAQATYTVKRAGTKQQVAVTLSNVPEEVLAQWIGEHMLHDHTATQIAATNP